MVTTGVGRSITGAYASCSRFSEAADRTPKTSRSGRRVSSIAKPSRRNSGFQASSTPAATVPSARPASSWAASRSAVPDGTVDLPTSSAPSRAWASSAENAASTADRSAANSPAFCGVPTHTKCTSPNAPASSCDVVKRNRPDASCSVSSSGRPGSKNGTTPAASEATLASSTSRPRTS